MKNARFGETLRVLAQHQVEFIVGGMAAGILPCCRFLEATLDEIRKKS